MDTVKVQAYVRISGRREIVKRLLDWTGSGLIYDDLSDQGRGEWDALFMGREVVNRKGKVAKRLRSSVKKAHGHKLTPEQMSEIGNMANESSTAGGEFMFEYDNPINMRQGEFGDGDSCFYSDYESNRYAMGRDERFHVLKVYDKDGQPIARAWTFSADDGATVIFNAYGKLSRIKIASIVSSADNAPPSRKATFNANVYINGGDKASAIGGNQDRDDYSADLDYDHIYED